METRCFWPPLRVMPLSPRIVSYCLLKPMIFSCTTAFLATAIISSSVEFSFPNLILFFMVSEKRKASCGTAPIACRRLCRFNCLIGTSSIRICPESISYKRAIRSSMVDFPEPVFPNMATVSPLFIVKDMLFRAVMLVSS